MRRIVLVIISVLIISMIALNVWGDSCKKCDTPLPDGAKFCPKCGEKVLQQKSDITFCPECGAKIEPPDAKFCPKCGNPFFSVSSTPSAADKKERLVSISEKQCNNDFGIKYLYEFSGGDWDSSNGLELSLLFPLTPKDLSSSDETAQWVLGKGRGRFYLEGFIDVISSKLDTDIIVDNRRLPLEGDFSTVVLGCSFLYKNKSTLGSSSASAYFGGGVGYYINNLKLSADTQNKLVDLYWDFANQKGLDLDSYNFEMNVENAVGFHLKAGVEIELSPQVYLSIDYRKNFVKADITGSEYAITNDGVNMYLDTISGKEKLEWGDMIIAGISVQF